MAKAEVAIRRRAPSKKSLETKARILDAAETLFARRGFDGTSVRDIAKLAGVQVALVHHHGGPKEDLFHQVISRRAKPLSDLRLTALESLKSAGEGLTVRAVLACFVEPFLDRTLKDEAPWRAYGRLIALVSADERWREIAADCFDPTAAVFVDELSELMPEATRLQVSSAFVFMVSGMLALTASSWRIGAVAQSDDAADLSGTLLDFCEAGFSSVCGGANPSA
ncbi:TetR/AcrR family transcriptional regulator [Roseibium denhamense]|uniref:Transcriptional regulator, TetR family n=1 Tax=Roseibium denhamense TaxID=76305 RepID=A0ABY1NPD3_9HYPH|nr:TetR/AcrR family transcriptional regulator [Roseibium denhamense]MTI07848.1 TetR/AcrR family transcriptional regulator [Roseibium denhamense]SMP14360.1 transcriptional regulator, TetR family [Roseibium denhamense]